MNRHRAKDVTEALASLISKTVKKVTTVTTMMLEQDTPELTGFAETNWIPVVGGERNDPIGTRALVDFSAQASAIAAINASYVLPQLVYISNPVPYIQLLNSGSSAKAPKDFVQTSIAKALKSII